MQHLSALRLASKKSLSPAKASPLPCTGREQSFLSALAIHHHLMAVLRHRASCCRLLSLQACDPNRIISNAFSAIFYGEVPRAGSSCIKPLKMTPVKVRQKIQRKDDFKDWPKST